MSANEDEELSDIQFILRESVADLSLTAEDRKQKIINRRGMFKWLPVYFSSDLEHGSWWYVAGSIVTVLVPIIPMISLWYPYINNTSDLPRIDDTIVYALLVFMGIMFTVGSVLFIPVVTQPPMAPLCKLYHFHTNELLAMWSFFVGTITTIPVMAIFLYRFPENPEYRLAMACCIFASIAFYIFVLSCYPKKHKPATSEWISPILKFLCCSTAWIHYHFNNDFLIASHIMNICSWLSVGICVPLFLDALATNNVREMFDYAASFIDCIFFGIGSLYFVAGSYVKLDHSHHDPEAPSSSTTVPTPASSSVRSPITRSSDAVDTEMTTPNTSSSSPRASPLHPSPPVQIN